MVEKKAPSTPEPEKCPNCGRCPTCGKADFYYPRQTWPYYPYWTCDTSTRPLPNTSITYTT